MIVAMSIIIMKIIACLASPRRHQTCHFRKRATSAPAEGPAYRLDLARRCELTGSRTLGVA